MDEGLCFKCGGGDHIAKNCPEGHHLKGDPNGSGPPGSSKPQSSGFSGAKSSQKGLSSRAAGLDLAALEAWHNSVRLGKGQTSLRCNAIGIHTSEDSDYGSELDSSHLASAFSGAYSEDYRIIDDFGHQKTKYADEHEEHDPSESCGSQCTWDCFCICHDGLLSTDQFSAALEGCEEIQWLEICNEPLGDIRGEWATAYLNEYADMFPLHDNFVEKGGYKQWFSVYCCAEETYVIIDYLLVDLGEDGYDDGWVEVTATFIMSGRILPFMAELTNY
jgi:hypothetical protein